MKVVLSIGIFYVLYGVAGLLGFQHIPEKKRGKSWTKKYIRSCGVGWLLLGIPWIVLYVLNRFYAMPLHVTEVLLVLFSVPSVVYSFCKEKQYRDTSDADSAKSV